MQDAKLTIEKGESITVHSTQQSHRGPIDVSTHVWLDDKGVLRLSVAVEGVGRDSVQIDIDKGVVTKAYPFDDPQAYRQPA